MCCAQRVACACCGCAEQGFRAVAFGKGRVACRSGQRRCIVDRRNAHHKRHGGGGRRAITHGKAELIAGGFAAVVAVFDAAVGQLQLREAAVQGDSLTGIDQSIAVAVVEQGAMRGQTHQFEHQTACRLLRVGGGELGGRQGTGVAFIYRQPGVGTDYRCRVGDRAY